MGLMTRRRARSANSLARLRSGLLASRNAGGLGDWRGGRLCFVQLIKLRLERTTKGEKRVAEASIPVDLFNPGQVFACIGLAEAADVILGDAEGCFDWASHDSPRFHL